MSVILCQVFETENFGIVQSCFYGIYLILFIWERERENEQGGARGEGERESQADSMPSMEPNVGLDPMTL